ncbi:MAG: hypothetical protein BMS9Abin01_1913 [Gammaproteobacteria bacterium]|nr:MAG: hypothetical protein BMS9Abin01_1913 [Gammaproteobacteria bacterium]
MRISYLIIDDFCDDPHAVPCRNIAAAARNSIGTRNWAPMIQLFFFTLDTSKLHGFGSVMGPTIEISRDPGSSRPEYE